MSFFHVLVLGAMYALGFGISHWLNPTPVKKGKK